MGSETAHRHIYECGEESGTYLQRNGVDHLLATEVALGSIRIPNDFTERQLDENLVGTGGRLEVAELALVVLQLRVSSQQLARRNVVEHTETHLVFVGLDSRKNSVAV